jgi:hypothetical protein
MVRMYKRGRNSGLDLLNRAHPIMTGTIIDSDESSTIREFMAVVKD